MPESNSVPKVDISLDDLPTLVGQFVHPPKVYCVHHDDRKCQQVAGNASIHARPVVRRVLLAENQGSCNATDTPETDQRGRAESTFPMSADVVGLVSHASRNATWATDAYQERCEESQTCAFGKALGECEPSTVLCHRPREPRTRIGSPIRPQATLIRSRGPLTLYLSPNQATAHMNPAATKYGGVERHWDCATVIPMFSLRRIGKKKDSADVKVVQQLPLV